MPISTKRVFQGSLAVFTAIVVLFGAFGPVASAEDWPRWRGPNGDGISKETSWSVDALKSGPTMLWGQNVSAGYSAVAVAGDRLYTMGNADGKDYVGCLDVATGKVVWDFSYPCKPAQYPGPRATPFVDGDKVYTFSSSGDLFCLNAADGKKVWGKNVLKETNAQNITWGLAGSPVIDGDLVIVNAGEHGMAYNKNTGEKVWASSPKQCGYATPVVYELGGVRSVAIFGAKAVYGVELATGKKLWSFDWQTDYDVNAADPLVFDHYVFITSGYGRGCALIDIAGNAAKKVWENKNIAAHFQSNVYIDGVIYGINGSPGGGQLTCLDAMKGDVKWKQETGFGSLIVADDKFIITNERGGLFVAAVDPSGYKELYKGKALEPKSAKVWTPPVLANGRLYIRTSNGDLACIDAGVK